MIRVLCLSLLIAVLGVSSAGAVRLQRVDGRTGQGSDVALVFFHGLRSDPFDTFKAADGPSWFEIIRKDQRPLPLGYAPAAFDVFVVDWSDVFQAKTNTAEAAGQIHDHRSFRGLFRDYNHLVLVGHSMGGIIIKHVLLLMAERRQDRYLNRVIGVGFLATPSTGAPLADIVAGRSRWCSLPLVRHLCGQPGWDLIAAELFGARWQQIADLATVARGNTFLDRTEASWATLYHERHRPPGPRVPLHVACAHERRPMVPELDLTIVPKLYATTTCSGRMSAINKDHRAIAQVAGIEDNTHDWLFNLLEEALRVLERTPIKAHPDGRLLGGLLNDIEHFARVEDLPTGLKVSDERLVIEPPADRATMDRLRLGRTPGIYAAPTYARLLETIAAANPCLAVDPGLPTRRTVMLRFSEPPHACRDDASFACRPERCR